MFIFDFQMVLLIEPKHWTIALLRWLAGECFITIINSNWNNNTNQRSIYIQLNLLGHASIHFISNFISNNDFNLTNRNLNIFFFVLPFRFREVRFQ